MRSSNVLQFLTAPRHGELMPLRMAEFWTRQLAEAFAEVNIPLSFATPSSVDVAFTLPSQWQEALQDTDANFAGRVTELAGREASAPEPGAEVGPDDAVWQVELAWLAVKVVVVIDDEPNRPAWLTAAGWTVTNAQRSPEFDALADVLSDQVGGNR